MFSPQAGGVATCVFNVKGEGNRVLYCPVMYGIAKAFIMSVIEEGMDGYVL